MLVWATCFLLASRIGQALSALTNISIDDQSGDPVTNLKIQYSDHWSFGPGCSNCEAKVDPTEAFDETWHDTSFLPGGPLVSASATFTGSAVYVVCILTGSTNDPNGNSDMTFLLDGIEGKPFQKSPDGNPAFLYNNVVFSADNLEVTEHNITLVAGKLGQQSLVLLDRIIYTTETNDETPPSQVSSPDSNSAQSTGVTTTVITKVVTEGASKKTIVLTATQTSDVTQSVTEITSLSTSTGSQAPFSSTSSQSNSSPTSTGSNTKAITSPTETSSSQSPSMTSGTFNGQLAASAGHNRHAVAIALGVLGSIVALVGAAFGFFCLRNRRRHLKLRAAPWFGRLSTAAGEEQARNSSLSVGLSRVSAASLHGEAGTSIMIPSIYADSIPHTDISSEPKPPLYEVTDSSISPGVYSGIPFLEKF